MRSGLSEEQKEQFDKDFPEHKPKVVVVDPFAAAAKNHKDAVATYRKAGEHQHRLEEKKALLTAQLEEVLKQLEDSQEKLGEAEQGNRIALEQYTLALQKVQELPPIATGEEATARAQAEADATQAKAKAMEVDQQKNHEEEQKFEFDTEDWKEIKLGLPEDKRAKLEARLKELEEARPSKRQTPEGRNGYQYGRDGIGAASSQPDPGGAEGISSTMVLVGQYLKAVETFAKKRPTPYSAG